MTYIEQPVASNSCTQSTVSNLVELHYFSLVRVIVATSQRNIKPFLVDMLDNYVQTLPINRMERQICLKKEKP